jgi:hypothetical protein
MHAGITVYGYDQSEARSEGRNETAGTITHSAKVAYILV